MATKTKQSKSEKRKSVSERRTTMIDQIVLFKRSVLMSHLEGRAMVVDTAKDFIDTALEKESRTSTKEKGDTVRTLSKNLTDAARDAHDQLLDVPNRMFDKFYEEFRESEKEESEEAEETTKKNEKPGG